MTRLIEILISLAIVAVLFVVVGLVLPASRHLVHSAETNRKQTIAFDTINSFRRFAEWNPLVLRDPQMQIKLSGPESGKGARMEYVSQENGLGSGSWEIVESTPNERVAFAITSSEPGENKRTAFTLKPTGRGGRNTRITQNYSVDYGWNLLGRYAGMYVSSNFGEDMKLGLSRLSNLLAAVPNFDYSDMPVQPKIVDRPSENLLVLSAAVPRDNEAVLKQMKINQEWIKKVMEANKLEAAGPVRIITNEMAAETYSFDVVQPVRKIVGEDETAPEGQLEIEVSNNVEAVYSEPTKAVTVPFTGHMANLTRVRDTMRAWAMTHGHQVVQRPYEDWKNGLEAGFTEEGEFDVYWAIR